MKTVFVSSTFRDMQFERDAIREITAPLVNAQARRHNDAFDFCDLRWGINTLSMTQEESARKVLDVCLDVIDRCASPMVVILGDRYGWLPPAEQISAAAARKRLRLKPGDYSVTALEVEYGALRDTGRFQNTLFYFRTIEGDAPPDYQAQDETDRRRMQALKKRIRERGGRVRDYTLRWTGKGFAGVTEFANAVAADIAAFMQPVWAETEALSPFDRDRRRHRTFIEEKAALFRARKADANALRNEIEQSPVTIVKGDVGSGKSTLFCHLAQKLKGAGWEVLPFISGLTPGSSSAEDVLKGAVYWLENRLGLPHAPAMDERTGKGQPNTAGAIQKQLEKLCRRFAKTGGRLLMMIDAADQLSPTEARDKLAFLPYTAQGSVHFFMTCTPDFPTHGRQCYALGPIGPSDKRAVIAEALSAGHELPASAVKLMLEMPASDNPLYLSLLVQRLQMMDQKDFAAIGAAGGGMKAIEARQLALLKHNCPGDLNSMSAALLSEAAARVNPDTVPKAARYLAVSRHGLRRQDLAALLGKQWTELEFARFINLLPDCFMQLDDGRFDFSHKSIRAGFLKGCRDTAACNRQILAYLKKLDPADPVRIAEIAYHTIGADDRRFFTEYVTEYYTSHRSYTEQAAKDLHTHSLTDGGAWITGLLHSLQYTFATDTLLWFILTVFRGVFTDSQKELELLAPILDAALEYGETLYASFRVAKNARVLIACCRRAAQLRETLGDKQNLDQALRLCKRAVSLADSLLRAQDAPENRRLLAACCRQYGSVYEDYGSREALKYALALYERSYGLCEQLLQSNPTPANRAELARCCGLTGSVYEALGNAGDMEKALSFYEKELRQCLLLDEEKATVQSRALLADGYVHVAGIHKKMGGAAHLQLALELYEQNLKLAQQAAKKQITARTRRELSVAYDLLGDIYETMDGDENCRLALNYFRRSLRLCEELADELNTAQSRRDLSVSLNRVADLLARRGGKRDLEQAMELCGRDIALSEQLEKELHTAESKRDLAVSLSTAAGFYTQHGEKEDLLTAQKYHRRSVALREQLAAARRTAQSLADLSQGYLRCIDVCMQLGDARSMTLAKELSRKNLEAADAFAGTCKTEQSYNALVLALYCSASMPDVGAAQQKKLLQRAQQYALALCRKYPDNETYRDLLEEIKEELGTE